VGERKPQKITRMPSIIGYRFDLLLFFSILFHSSFLTAALSQQLFTAAFSQLKP
jgi:hypothetical protein